MEGSDGPSRAPGLRYLWTGKHQGCTGSSAEQTTPSCGRSSELLPAAENSTETVCRGGARTAVSQSVSYSFTSTVKALKLQKLETNESLSGAFCKLVACS